MLFRSNKFLIVWFKNKGVDIYSEVYDKAKTEKEDKVQKTYLPKFEHLKNPNRLSGDIKYRGTTYNFSLEKYFDDYFDKKNDYFFCKCKEIADFLIPHLLNNHTVNESDYLKILEKNSSFFKLSGVDLLTPEFNLEEFENILFKREIFKMGFMVCNKPPNEMLYFIKHCEFCDKQNFPLKYDIWTQLFIPWVSDKFEKRNFSKYSKFIENSLSDVESDLLTYYKQLK